ncbi:hypothetical protein CSOJ01_00939 [Colletotrichum sojae]|uniref:Uncharacterized protein n=1 Tax=Colletotrichum sojae TaxID=2175907 RepID=A0A8H6JWQ9_9PEZI|nr:hypothetical protein CSOJ01_00939 [Colletotrichum sojae]
MLDGDARFVKLRDHSQTTLRRATPWPATHGHLASKRETQPLRWKSQPRCSGKARFLFQSYGVINVGGWGSAGRAPARDAAEESMAGCADSRAAGVGTTVMQ